MTPFEVLEILRPYAEHLEREILYLASKGDVYKIKTLTENLKTTKHFILAMEYTIETGYVIPLREQKEPYTTRSIYKTNGTYVIHNPPASA